MTALSRTIGTHFRILGLLAAAAWVPAGAALAADKPVISIGAAARIINEVATGAGQSRLHIVLEGAGRIGAARIWAQCAVIDTVVDKKIVAGKGDCEFRSTQGELVFAAFETDPGVGDRGKLVFSGGLGRLANLGSVPVEVSVNPHRVGKQVFYVESAD